MTAFNAGFADLAEVATASKKRAKHGLLDDVLTPEAVVAKLNDEFDAWAMILKVSDLRAVLPYCPSNVRVGAWIRTVEPGTTLANKRASWEPVIFMTRGIRKLSPGRKPWLDHHVEPYAPEKRIKGSRPPGVYAWIFEGLELKQRDSFVHLFQKDDRMTAAWKQWQVRNNPNGFQLEFFSDPTLKPLF